MTAVKDVQQKFLVAIKSINLLIHKDIGIQTMTPLEKLEQAKELLIEAETELINDKGSCPYEIGFTLRNLDEAINHLKKTL